jgi:hypothetical protein
LRQDTHFASAFGPSLITDNYVCPSGSWVQALFRRRAGYSLRGYPALFFVQTSRVKIFKWRIMLTTYSNEAKIQRTLKQLGCAAQNFCKFAGVGLTRFLQAINAEPGKHFRDEHAAHLLEVLGELYELQVDVDAITGTHIPINLRSLGCRHDRVNDPPSSQDCSGRARPHLGFSGALGNHGVDGAAMKSCNMIDLDKPRVGENEILDIAIGFLFDGRPMSECCGYLLSEYQVSARDLDPLLEKAQREVRECEVEFGTRLRF